MLFHRAGLDFKGCYNALISSFIILEHPFIALFNQSQHFFMSVYVSLYDNDIHPLQ